MNTNNVLRFLGLATLTYSWLEANRLFFNVIVDAINYHNEQIRLKTVENCFKLIAKNIEVYDDESEDRSKDKSKNKSEDESEDESEVESEVVVETVTKTILKS